MRNKSDSFQWNIIAVYGETQVEHKQIFLTELVQCYQKESLTLVIGGYFNIMNDDNNDRYDDQWP